MMKTPLCLVTCLLASSAAFAQNADIFGHLLPAQKHTRVFGQEIAYYDMGTAKADEPVLVLLHGYGSQADVDFGPSLPLLEKQYRVIALDQIGAGQSAKPLIAYRVQTYVEFLAEFLRTQGITHFDLLGESLGGWTAAAYAQQSLTSGSTLPKPSRLILEDAAGFSAPETGFSPSAGIHLSVSTVGEVVTGLRAVFYNKSLITEDVARRRFITKLAANDGLVTSTFSSNPAVRSEALGEKASSITIPTLVIWGAQDTTVPIAMGRAYAKTIPQAKLVTIDESGHVPSLEQPQRFVKAVEDFLAGK
ncbi:alpha/beta fold hydrolase [Terriglobus sp. RCC_193]|uniref:alpha/beta fold hydrolase n=1 Tax=Terriglobus sp. RCC_193 TaxID=3239218 RepID=UPI003525F5A7